MDGDDGCCQEGGESAADDDDPVVDHPEPEPHVDPSGPTCETNGAAKPLAMLQSQAADTHRTKLEVVGFLLSKSKCSS